MTQTALITGASGGIGLDFAKKFAQEGYNVILVARSKDKLTQLANDLGNQYKIEAQAIAMDLSDPGAPQALYDQLQASGVTVDVLVNNAGFASYGYFHELDTAKEMQMIQLNIATLTYLTRLFLPGMVERKNGKILNVASTAAFQPGPLMAVYYATKAYVLHFSEAIANELQGTGVTVTTLCPGPTESGFQERAAMTDSKLVQNGLMSSRAVVDAGYNALMAGKPVVIPGFMNRMMALTPRLFPRGMMTRLVRGVQERVGH
jgi:uncharacterized protein